MVSTVEPSEANWSERQKQLTSSRSKNAGTSYIPRRIDDRTGINKPRQINNNQKTTNRTIVNQPNTKSILNKNTYRNTKAVITPRSNPRSLPTNRHSETNTVRSSHTPLPKPNQQRNSSIKNNDPYGINPLPQIQSPYVSARDQSYYPNLDSWGEKNYSNYDDNSYTTFDHDRMSPFLPTYNLSKKPKKAYFIAPKFRRPLEFEQQQNEQYDQQQKEQYDQQQNELEINNQTEMNTKFNYIQTIPYSRFENPILNNEIENFNLRSNQNIENVHSVLKTMDAKNYDGKELFSTKFLEDLDYQAQYIPPKSTKIYKKQEIYNQEAENQIKLIKQEVNNSVPLRNSIPPQKSIPSQNNIPTRNSTNILKEAIFNGVTLDIAEKIFDEEIVRQTKEIVSRNYNEELNKTVNLDKPTFDKIYETVANQMFRDIATEVLTDGLNNAKKVDNNEIKKVAKEEIVSNLMLDHMLDKMAQHGRISGENEDISKVLDGMIIDVLLKTNKNVQKVEDRTLKNYPLKKFHLNSFMNVALDILVAELSTNLEEDMNDLEIIEQNRKKSNKY